MRDTVMLPTKLYVCVALLIAAVHIEESNAMVEHIDHLPPDLQWYLDVCHSSGNLTEHSARLVFWTSINQYISKFVQSRPDLSPQQAQYLENTLEEAFAPLCEHPGEHTGEHTGERVKRQAGPGVVLRVRKEVRAMTGRERRRYFAAVNGMKRDRSLPPNVYDFLQNYHTGANIGRAHFGPAFPGWHRLYLWIFEYFLRLQDSTATIPYWASVLDNDMQDPTQSVIFSRRYFGNGNGVIRTGPFRDWPRINPQTSFTRNVQGGELFTYNGINRILRRRRNRQILVPTAQPNSNFEFQHGSAHVFVGGSMNNLNSAARDPIFFSHHCFVDQIWQRFRENQRNRGINPATDYPFDENDPRFRPEHRPTANAGFTGLSGASSWTQILGYSNIFSDLIVYDPVPACPRCADSRDLFCNRNLNPPRCVSRQRGRGGGIVGTDPAPIGLTDPTPGIRVRRHVPIRYQDNMTEVCPRNTLLNDVETKRLGGSEPLPGMYTNTWAYIPVKVVSKRPEEYTDFARYSLYGQRPSARYGSKNELLKQGLQRPFENCGKNQDALGKITIVAYGLNYDGYSEEYALMDNRLGVAEANAVIPVKTPTGSSPSETIIAAFDSCGRVCKPYCKRSSSQFSGGIKVSYSQPREFSDSYADALFNIWNVSSQSSCPSLNYDNIPVSFFCEYTDTWIWESPSTMTNQVQGVGVHNVYPVRPRTTTGDWNTVHQPAHGDRASPGVLSELNRLLKSILHV